MSIGQWSTTAANNATADPTINWAEGQPPSTVNDSARAMMAAIATWFAAAEWLNYALTPTYVNGTTFTVAGNQTAIYTVGRRVRTFNTAGTLYGTIATSAYSTVTTVTLTMDSGALDSGLSEVDVGFFNPATPSFPSYPSSTVGGQFTTLSASANDALLYINGSGQSIPNNLATNVTGWTKSSDRVNANFNAATGIFTAPATGYYHVSAQISFSAITSFVGCSYLCQITVNGGAVAVGVEYSESATSIVRTVSVSAVVSMSAGQTLAIQAYQDTGSALSLLPISAQNILSISRIP